MMSFFYTFLKKILLRHCYKNTLIKKEKKIINMYVHCTLYSVNIRRIPVKVNIWNP